MFFPPPIAKLEIRKEEGKKFAQKIQTVIKKTNKSVDAAVREEGKIVKKAFIEIIRGYIGGKHKNKVSAMDVKVKPRPVKSGKSRGIGRKGYIGLKKDVGWSWKSGPWAGKTGTPALVYWLLFGTKNRIGKGKNKGAIKGKKDRGSYDIWKEVSSKVGTKARKLIKDAVKAINFDQ